MQQKNNHIYWAIMKLSSSVTYIYIDGANLHRGTLADGWELDYAKFYIYLKEKYKTIDIFLFLGLIPSKIELYTSLQKIGFKILFKEISRDKDGAVKGNCDTDLVLNAVTDYFEKTVASGVLVSGDGDYASLIQFWKKRRVHVAIESPRRVCSFLLRKQNVEITYLPNKRELLQLPQTNVSEKKKPPAETEHRKGL
jgi:uncharacterized LabA/DUF88 family protein